MKKNQKLKAFTLAETLITLMVIGVIAVMTIPTLKDHSDEVQYVTAAKKAYAAVTNATQAVEAKHTESYFWNFTDAKTLRWYNEVVNTIPNPDPAHTSWTIVTIDGNTYTTFTPSLWTADGMAWQLTTPDNGCGNKGGKILVDTNGSKQPNTVGIDVHGFIIGHRSCKAAAFGVYAMGDGCNDGSTNFACTAYAIREGKMPWFREPGKYTSCAPFLAPSTNCPTFN